MVVGVRLRAYGFGFQGFGLQGLMVLDFRFRVECLGLRFGGRVLGLGVNVLGFVYGGCVDGVEGTTNPDGRTKSTVFDFRFLG